MLLAGRAAPQGALGSNASRPPIGGDKTLVPIPGQSVKMTTKPGPKPHTQRTGGGGGQVANGLDAELGKSLPRNGANSPDHSDVKRMQKLQLTFRLDLNLSRRFGFAACHLGEKLRPGDPGGQGEPGDPGDVFSNLSGDRA